jgi:nicotinate phosphoribosyltransferase
VLAARASYLSGFTGTATTLAGSLFGIPLFGTMAHSFIQAHDSELEAFEHFADSHGGRLVLLIDTYDTLVGAERVVELARRRPDLAIAAVRLDSGDLGLLARQVRTLFDAAGLSTIEIFASGNLDERRIEALVAGRAPIEGFGVGTSLDVSADCPALDCVYKLQEYAGRPRRKRSAGKATWPGAKQVFRQLQRDGRFMRDVLAPAGEEHPGTPLLAPVVRRGRLVETLPSLAAIREHAARQLAGLPAALRGLDRPAAYDVEIAATLVALAQRVDREFH